MEIKTIADLLEALSGYYGKAYARDDAQVVGDMVARIVQSGRYDMAFVAVKEHVPKRFGLPEAADVKKALRAWEDEDPTAWMRPVSLHEAEPEMSVEERERNFAEMRAEAEKVGIDVTRPHWLADLILDMAKGKKLGLEE